MKIRFIYIQTSSVAGQNLSTQAGVASLLNCITIQFILRMYTIYAAFEGTLRNQFRFWEYRMIWEYQKHCTILLLLREEAFYKKTREWWNHNIIACVTSPSCYEFIASIRNL